MTARTIVIRGAGGGHGASTVAASLALLAAENAPTTLVTDEPAAMAALLGLATHDGDAAFEITPNLRLTDDATDACTPIVVIDAASDARDREPPSQAETYVVVRGPCYLALRRLLSARESRPDGVIVIVEDGRSLRS